MADVTGTDQVDQLSGTEGADVITGGRGYDEVAGGSGADVFVFRIGDGGGLPHDVITDFEVGVDRLALPAGVALHTEDDPAGQWVHYGDDRGNNDWVQLRGVRGATLDQLTAPNSPSPTPGNDSITGTDGSEAINALAGNDTVSGGNGLDTITGGPGTDVMSGGLGQQDVFAFNYGDGGDLPHDVITDFELRRDTLVFPAGAALHTEDDAAGQWIHYGEDRGNNDWVQLLGVYSAPLDLLLGGSGPPPNTPTLGADTLRGTSGDDVINALAGDDQVDGRAGADTISGGPGVDLVSGGPGVDVFLFGYGDGGALPHDQIAGFQVLTDRLVFPAGAELYTEEGAAGQWVHYGDDLGNNDWVQLLNVRGATLAQLTGLGDSPPNTPTLGNDTLVGTPGADSIGAGAGNDSVSGGGGADTLDGGEGNDTLSGQEGDDRIAGGFGRDVVRGGEGADTFVFGVNATFDAGTGAFTSGVADTGLGDEADAIADFDGAGVPGGDIIDLSTINMFGRREPTDATFQFIGTAEFSGSGGPQVRYELRDRFTLIQMDGVQTLSNPNAESRQADGIPDAEIIVVGGANFI
ncbi:MAG TPA: hypothetical protein VE033_05665, partial [Acetobacteraceae bacterium]|nr:hypothetical protein [Acetobacteraceae bacterium]